MGRLSLVQRQDWRGFVMGRACEVMLKTNGFGVSQTLMIRGFACFFGKIGIFACNIEQNLPPDPQHRVICLQHRHGLVAT
jgi:hypothetical protein